MDEEIVKRIVKELVQLQMRVALLQGQLSLLTDLTPEWIDRQVEEKLLSDEARVIYEMVLQRVFGPQEY